MDDVICGSPGSVDPGHASQAATRACIKSTTIHPHAKAGFREGEEWLDALEHVVKNFQLANDSIPPSSLADAKKAVDRWLSENAGSFPYTVPKMWSRTKDKVIYPRVFSCSLSSIRNTFHYQAAAALLQLGVFSWPAEKKINSSDIDGAEAASLQPQAPPRQVSRQQNVNHVPVMSEGESKTAPRTRENLPPAPVKKNKDSSNNLTVNRSHDLVKTGRVTRTTKRTRVSTTKTTIYRIVEEIEHG
ncbi:MAG: hypothetical protein Q9227_003217 [Pyrenula ochraceoflavens]